MRARFQPRTAGRVVTPFLVRRAKGFASGQKTEIFGGSCRNLWFEFHVKLLHRLLSRACPISRRIYQVKVMQILAVVRSPRIIYRFLSGL